MKSGISIIANELAGLLIPFVLSAIVHTSVFLINPTFSFNLGDKSRDDGRFLIVELRKQGPGVRVQGSVVSNQQSVTVGKQSMVGSRTSSDGIQKGKAKNKRSENTAKFKNIAKPAKARDKQPLKEVKVVVPQEYSHPMPEKTANETSIAHSKIRGHENSHPPLLSGDHEESSSTQTSTEVAQVDSIQPVTEEPKIVAEAANDTEGTETFLVSSNITEVQPSPGSVNKELEEVKDREEERPVAHVDTHVVDIRKEALNKTEDTSAKNEIEAKKDEIVETDAAEEKREDVAHGETNSTKEDPSPVNETSMLLSSTKEVENPHPPLNLLPSREGIQTVPSPLVVEENLPPPQGEGWGEDGHKTSSEQKIGQIAKAEVAEKVEEPATVVEHKTEAPAKKKPRSIHIHKMLEPEKDATIGIPVGRPVVKITSPSRKKTISRVQGISGRAQGNGVSRVTLSTNGEHAVITVQNGRFLWDTVLREGKNTISASVWDMEGYSATDSITVEVLPPKNSFELSIDGPTGELESPVAMVRGRVGDLTVDTVRLIVNGEFVETPVEDGYFEKTVFLKERENTMQAEAVNSAGLTARSGVLKIAVKNPMVPDILLHLLCEGHDMESHPKVTLRERSQLDDEKGAVSDVDVVEMMSANEGYWEKVFAIEEARDGAYALNVSGGTGTDCKLVVTLNSSKKKVRVFEKRLMEGEVWAVGRFIFPEGVFWDEDEWFSGRIEDKDSITKYKSPEGVTWKELKEGP